MSGSVDGRRYEHGGRFPRFMVLTVILDMVGFILRDLYVPRGSGLGIPVTVAILVVTTVISYWLVYRGGFDRLNPLS